MIVACPQRRQHGTTTNRPHALITPHPTYHNHACSSQPLRLLQSSTNSGQRMRGEESKTNSERMRTWIGKKSLNSGGSSSSEYRRSEK